MQDYPTFVLHKFPVEGDTFGFAGGAGNVVFFGEFIVELRHEGGFDAAAFLVDRVLGAVDDVFDAPPHLLHIFKWRNGAVEFKEFIFMVAERIILAD